MSVEGFDWEWIPSGLDEAVGVYRGPSGTTYVNIVVNALSTVTAIRGTHVEQIVVRGLRFDARKLIEAREAGHALPLIPARGIPLSGPALKRGCDVFIGPCSCGAWHKTTEV